MGFFFGLSAKILVPCRIFLPGSIYLTVCWLLILQARFASVMFFYLVFKRGLVSLLRSSQAGSKAYLRIPLRVEIAFLTCKVSTDSSVYAARRINSNLKAKTFRSAIDFNSAGLATGRQFRAPGRLGAGICAGASATICSSCSMSDFGNGWSSVPFVP